MTVTTMNAKETHLRYDPDSDTSGWDIIRRGHMTITVVNEQNHQFCYKINKAENANLWFVAALRGPDNENDYSYIGMLVTDPLKDHALRHTDASRYPVTSAVFQVANWALFQIHHNRDLPEGYRIMLAGRCRKCGRTLTVASSIESGIGPKCAGMEGE